MAREVFAAYAQAHGTDLLQRLEDSLKPKPAGLVTRHAPSSDGSTGALTGCRLSFDAGESVVTVDGVERFRHGLASECAKWVREQGLEFTPTHADPFYQAIDPYRVVTRKGKP